MNEKTKKSYDKLLNELEYHKEFERQLIISEEKYRTLAENLNVGVYRNTPGAKGKFIEVNPAFLKIFGYKNKESILNLNVADLYVDPNSRIKFSNKLKKQGFLRDEEVELKKKDGTNIICSISASAIKNDNGKISHYDGIIEDITERKNIELSLLASEERFRKLFNSAHDAFMTIHPPKWNFTSGNPAMLQLFNIKSMKDYLALHPADLSPKKQPDGRLSSEKSKECIEKALETGSYFFEWTHKKINGKTFPATVLLTKVEVQNEIFLQATVRDISERKKEEELREKLLETAKHLTESLDQNSVLNQISKQARSLLNCQGISIYMLDKDGKTIKPIYSHDPPYDKEVMSTTINIDNSLTGMVIKQGKSQIFNDANQNPNSYHVPGTPEEDEDYLIISPFIIDGKVIGTMNLYRKNIEFTEDDLLIVNTFAAYATTAIKNARTYNNLLAEMSIREKAEAKVRLNEEKYRTLTENLNVGIYRVTPGSKGEFIEVNQAFLDMFGYENKDSLKEINVADFYKDPAKRKAIGKKLKDQGFLKNEEIIFVKKNGRPFIGSDTAIAVKNKEGKIIYYDGIIDDITERVALRNKLIENEEKYRSLVNSSPDIIIRVDREGIINYINYMFTGEKPVDIIGKSIYELMPSEFHNKAKQALDVVFKTGDRFSYEHIGISSKEEIKWYRNNVGPIESKGKITGATIIARDITEEKQIDIMKTEFISSVSHELRTPLAIIQESISQVLDGLHGELSDSQTEVLNPCINDIERLTRIINNLLDISKIEGQKVSITRDMVDIVSLAKNVLSSFKIKADNKNVELRFKSSVKKAELYIDHDRIIQVFMNLLGNALKFMENGHIELSISKSENEVECAVTDTGVGIPHKELASVFDRFHQVGKAINKPDKGTGLGLSISKGIIELHNGNIGVDSKVNVGSKFFFTLPIYTEDEILFENIEKGIIVATRKHIKLSLLIIRLDSFDKIKKMSGLKLAKGTTHKVLEAFQDVIAPGEFSFIKGRNEVVLFSDITRKNIFTVVDTLEKILYKFVSEFNDQTKIEISYGYSVYPNDGENAKELIESAYKTLLNKDHN